MIFEPKLIDSRLCVMDASGALVCSDITAFIEYPGNDYNVLTAASQGSWQIGTDKNGFYAKNDNVTMWFHERDGILFIKTEMKNTTGKAIEAPETFCPFAANLQGRISLAVCNQYRETNKNKINDMICAIDKIIPVNGAVYESADICGLRLENGLAPAAVFGQATYQKYFGGVSLSRDGHITGKQILEGKPIPAGGSVVSDTFMLMFREDLTDAMEEYAETVYILSGEKRRVFDVPAGFCTWYYYLSHISRDTLTENMDVLHQRREQMPVTYVQVDDGWFDKWGSWEPNEKFGRDMKAFAEDVKRRGFLPGIWVAPFGAVTDAPIYKEHPDWFVHYPDGSEWTKPWPSLDFSHPDARAYIAALFHKLSYDWGFRYIKMDIISPTLAPGLHYDKGLTALENYRIGLKTFRESVTEDTFLLACTAPLAPAAGLVDGMRVSGDIFERWESLRIVFNSVFNRFYMNKTFFINDADCLLVRKKENEDEECRRLCTRTDTEIRTYVTAMAASGGVLMFSDKLSLLTDREFELISKLFPLNTEAARPLDYETSYLPGVLDFGYRKQNRTIALINWNDTPGEFTLPGSAGKHAFEFWESRYYGVPAGDLKITIEPHDCRVFTLTSANGPAVIGTDASLVMDIDWSYDNGFQATKNKAGETLFAIDADGSFIRL